jgi:hypothetical protein
MRQTRFASLIVSMATGAFVIMGVRAACADVGPGAPPVAGVASPVFDPEPGTPTPDQAAAAAGAVAAPMEPSRPADSDPWDGTNTPPLVIAADGTMRPWAPVGSIREIRQSYAMPSDRWTQPLPLSR